MAAKLNIGIQQFVRTRVSPKVTSFAAKLGFTNRYDLTTQLHQLGTHLAPGQTTVTIQNLASQGILKKRFANNLQGLSGIEHFMLEATTPTDVTEAIQSINNTFSSAMLCTAELEATNEALAQGQDPTQISLDDILPKLDAKALGLAAALFPGAAKEINMQNQGVSNALKFGLATGFANPFLLLTITAIGAAVALPFIFPALSIASVASFGAVAKYGGLGLTAFGGLAKYCDRYKHEADTFRGKLGRLREKSTLVKHSFTIGITLSYIGLAGTIGSGHFLKFGSSLLQYWYIAAPLAWGIPSIMARTYNYFGIKSAMQANEGKPALYGKEGLAEQNIRNTYKQHGNAFIHYGVYFAYRSAATLAFLTIAFGMTLNPITILGVLGAQVTGFGLAYAITKNGIFKDRSPFRGMIGGVLGSVAAPIALGFALGDPTGMGIVDGLISQAVYSSDVHMSMHGITYHKGNLSALYKDRLVPNLSVAIKRKLAGYHGRREKRLTAMAEKPFVSPKDIVFSVNNSVFFDPYADTEQFVIQCDALTSGFGRFGDNATGAERIRATCQKTLDNLHAFIQRRRIENNALADMDKKYEHLAETMEIIAKFYNGTLTDEIEEFCTDENRNQPKGFMHNSKSLIDEFADWHRIDDVSSDIADQIAEELKAEAAALRMRARHTEHLSNNEVSDTFLYFLDRYRTEIILVIRKDDLRFDQKVQKNPNQSGTREIMGNTAVEILRFDEDTELASIERAFASHIRRKNHDWDHEDPAEEYSWLPRTQCDQIDPDHIKELREKVKSHSDDIVFVINNNQGKPQALQMKNGDIILLDAAIDIGTLRSADGNVIDPDKTNIITIDEFNQHSKHKIYKIHDASTGTEMQFLPLPDKIEKEQKKYGYYKRGLYTYSIDPHEYELNLDSEFVNRRTGYEYVPLFENDRKQQNLALSYVEDTPIQMQFAGIRDDNGFVKKDRLPDHVRINWNPMFLRFKIKGKWHLLPHLEEKNNFLQPTVEVAKENVSWEELLETYLPYITKTNRDRENNTITLIASGYEYGVEQGLHEIKFTLPYHSELPDPSPKTLVSLAEKAFKLNGTANSFDKIIEQKRVYNFRRIIGVRAADDKQSLEYIFDAEGEEAVSQVKFQADKATCKFLPPLDEIEDIEIEPFRGRVGIIPFARYTYSYATREEALAESEGLPIHEVRDENGNIIAYEHYRFAQAAESNMQLGTFDPSTFDPQRLELSSDGKTLTMHTLDWITKQFPIEASLYDLGKEDDQKVEVLGVKQQRDLPSTWKGKSVLWVKNGEEVQAAALPTKIRRPLSIIDTEAVFGTDGDLQAIRVFKKQKHHKLAIPIRKFLTDQDLRYIDWVDKVDLHGRKIRITFKNPHNGETWTSIREIDDARLDGSIYTAQNNEEHRPMIENHEIYGDPRDGGSPAKAKIEPYLMVTRLSKVHTISANNLPKEVRHSISRDSRLTVINPRSAIAVKSKTTGKTFDIPLADKIDGSKEYIFNDDNETLANQHISENDEAVEIRAARRFAHRKPHIEDGKLGLIIGPQLSISSRNWIGKAHCGVGYCAHDQSIFMAYDPNKGFYYGRMPYGFGPGGNIQPHKSRAGDGRIRETATVQNGTPVGRPLRKALAGADAWFELENEEPFISFAPMPATITEDYREGKGIYKRHGHASAFHPAVVAIGSGVENNNQIVTQRRRWPSSVPIGMYWFMQELMDEIVGAKIKGTLGFSGIKHKPSIWSWDQLLHEFNGVTWYYCGWAEYARMAAPMAYYLGFTPYPVDPVVFPIIWGRFFFRGLKAHFETMKKVGNHWRESLYYGPAIVKALTPNYVEMVTPKMPDMAKALSRDERKRKEWVTELAQMNLVRLADEALGQFGVTAMAGAEKLPGRYEWTMNNWITMSLAATALGIYGLTDLSMHPEYWTDIYDLIPISFGLTMNSFWPAYNASLSALGLRLAKQDTADQDPKLLADFIEGKLGGFKGFIRGYYGPNKRKWKMGIGDAKPRILTERGTYVEELSSEESAQLLEELNERGSNQLIDNLINQLNPFKVATMLEEMLITDEEAYENERNIANRNIANIPLNLISVDLMNQKRKEALAEAQTKQLASITFALQLFSQINDPYKKQQVLSSMKKEKRKLLEMAAGGTL